MEIRQTLIQIEDHQVYAEYRQAHEGFPTLILLNGLSQDVRNWDPFVEYLSSPNYGILRLDFRGQGRSLAWEIENRGKFDYPVPVEEQARDLKVVIEHFGIEPGLNLVAHSYGGGVALQFASRWPELIQKLVLVVPYLVRLDRSFPVQRAWASQTDLMRHFGFFPNATLHSVEKWYNGFLSHYMDYRYKGTVSDPVLRQALINLTFGIMRFDGFKAFSALPDHSVHLVSVGRDTLVPRTLYSEAWHRLPKGIKESWLFVEDGDHLLIDQAPGFCAQWTEMILQEDSRISGGRKFTGQAYAFEVQDENRHQVVLQPRFGRLAEGAV